MVTVRVIPCLDVSRGRVVKGVAFRNLRDAGCPARLARAYADQGADEIAVLDVAATPAGSASAAETVRLVSAGLFVPLTAGGGVRSLADVRRLLAAGADKVAICSAALADPALLGQAADAFGSQCVVLSIDAARAGNGWHACSHGGRRDTGRDAVAWAREGERLGAGEILLNSIDRDGAGAGYDLDLLKAVRAAVTVPLIASGGAGRPPDLLAAFRDGGADAALLASRLHDGTWTVAALKQYLRQEGVNVR